MSLVWVKRKTKIERAVRCHFFSHFEWTLCPSSSEALIPLDDEHWISIKFIQKWSGNNGLNYPFLIIQLIAWSKDLSLVFPALSMHYCYFTENSISQGIYEWENSGYYIILQGGTVPTSTSIPDTFLKKRELASRMHNSYWRTQEADVNRRIWSWLFENDGTSRHISCQISWADPTSARRLVSPERDGENSMAREDPPCSREGYV